MTKATCSSSSCCAHPALLAPGGQIVVPPTQVKGIGGFVRLGLLEVKGVNASKIRVTVDEGAKAITLNGEVKSESEQREVLSAAKDHAEGYRVKSALKIEP